MSYLEQQKAQRQAAQQARADMLQRSAAQLGAPSTAGVDAAQFKARQNEERSPFATLLMQLAQGYAGQGGGKRGGMGGMMGGGGGY